MAGEFLFLNEAEVPMAIPAQDLFESRRHPSWRPDRSALFTLLFPRAEVSALRASRQMTTSRPIFLVAECVRLSAWSASVQPVDETAAEDVAAQAAGRPDALLVTLAPQDALTLKYVNDAEVS